MLSKIRKRIKARVSKLNLDEELLPAIEKIVIDSIKYSAKLYIEEQVKKK